MSSNIRITKICRFCNNEFTAKTIKTKFCSLTCASKNYKKCSREKKKVLDSQKAESANSAEMEKLKKLAVLSIDESSMLMGFSRRTIYRLISRSELTISKVGSRNFIKRSDIDQFIEGLHKIKKDDETVKEFPGIENCYTISEAQQKFNVSPSALYGILKRQGIRGYSAGKFVYVSKMELDLLFNSKSHG
ncbi:helix-turn-helix domain-containing protein [Flavobacterium sp. YJ01]|uniref:helix-turn-helix domain-containing protein n=1 Tax=unclassified Flavobacterium TaxID=196869 RepID=UPI0023E41C14|nr:helix-turn-helix domain-containing protein [Flavobacterium sp. YJ01]WET02388.1 helix-turn-helix domain-containing protein [Flavobacterium sp. YJ01]